uniref:Uncharacterized protein n=1 Tax=Cannabis sativa TaxID=3483 RepID=A0A803PK32_CANSA
MLKGGDMPITAIIQEERYSQVRGINVGKERKGVESRNPFIMSKGNGLSIAYFPNEASIKKLTPPEKTFPSLRGAVTNSSMKKISVFEVFGLEKRVKERSRLSPYSPSLLGNQSLVVMNKRSKTKTTKKFEIADSRRAFSVNFVVITIKTPPELRYETLDGVTSGFKDPETRHGI